MPEIRCGQGKPRDRAGRADFRPRRLRRAISAQGRSARRRQQFAWFCQRSAAARRVSAISRAGRCSRNNRPRRRRPIRTAIRTTPIPTARVRQPGYGAPSSGPISLSAPGVAQQDDEIDLPAEGTPDYRPPAGRSPYSNAPSYPPRERNPAPYSERQDTAAAAARLGPSRGNPVGAGRSGRDQADGDAGVPDRLDARPLVCRIRCSRQRSAGSARASPRSSRSPPIPAAA